MDDMRMNFDYEHGEKLVQVKDLSMWFPMKYGVTDFISRKEHKFVKAVNNVDLDIYKGENLGLVGESGCGKSTLARSIIRLYKPTSGQIILDGKDITHLEGEALRLERPKMQYIFQDPYSSLNPRMSVYETIEEMLLFHKICPEEEVPNKVKEILEMCGLSMEVADRFPGEFSGGQRQRIGIARSLSVNPKLVIADEPVSALDVSIQAQIINLLGDLQRSLNLTILFISHDLRVVKYITHRVAVMYLGGIVELGKTNEVFDHPYHPYTQVLTKAAPLLDPTNRTREYAIEGEPPSPINMPSGCRFNPRCPFCQEICTKEVPELREVAPGRHVACHFPLQ